jgi:protein involved in polysaccharide export with SLBB domain
MEATKRECVKDAKMDGVLSRYLLNPATRVKVSVFEKPDRSTRQTAGMPNGISISNNGHMDMGVTRDETSALV